MFGWEPMGDSNVISLFIYRDLGAIKEEIMQRNIPYAEKVQRFELVKQEMLDIGKADHVIYNIGSLKDAYHEAIRIIRQEINTRDQKSLFQPGKNYKHPSGHIYEAVELAYDSSSGQAMVISKHTSGSLLTQSLRQFLREMKAIS